MALVPVSVLTSTLLSVAPCIFHVCDKTAHALICHISFINKGGFSFSQEGWKNFRWGASHVQYAILDASGGA